VDSIAYDIILKGGGTMAKAAKKKPGKKAAVRMKKSTGRKKASR
jgi:hypothetical protein